MERENRPSANDYNLPGEPNSLWLATTPTTEYPKPTGAVNVDVAIVGGGIVGVTAASLLNDAGLTVAIIEARRVVTGVTGYTTAKITSQHGLIYRRLIDKFGRENAQIYGDANQTALEKIADLIAAKSIDCDFIRTPAFTFSDEPADIGKIEAEVRAAQELGLPATYTEETSLPFPVRAAVRFDNQAQFHPRKYLLALIDNLQNNGSYIFENTRALNIDDDSPCSVITDRGRIKAKNVIIATHFPFFDKGFFFARLTPKQDYVLAAKINGPVPEGTYFHESGNVLHSIRNQPYGNESLLLVSGGTHKSGDDADTIGYYHRVEEYARERFDIKSIDWRWSAQNSYSVDGLPYIGKSHGSERIYVACGFGGWGMTNGTLSAMIMTDDILGRKNPRAHLFNPGRINLTALEKMAANGAHVVADFTAERLTRIEPGDPSTLAKGEGRLMRVNGKKAAACRDEAGNIHVVSIYCPHMNCIVNWNKAEITWDCPCHGSRFDAAGKMIHGPALADLHPIE